MANDVHFYRQLRNNTTGWVYNTVDRIYSMGHGILADSKLADTSGVFEPGVYKVTPFVAISRGAAPLGRQTFEFTRPSNVSSTYHYKIEGELSMVNHQHAPFEAATSATCIALQNEALLKAFGKVGDLSQLELGTELGELRETIELLQQTILAAMSPRLAWKYFSSHLKSEAGRSALIAKSLIGMPSKYMEFRYGWMPLVRSVHGIYEVLIEGLNKLVESNKIHTARGKAKTTKVLVKSVTGGITYAPTRSVFVNTAHITSRACVHYRIKNTPDLADLLGVSPKFIPETAWALTKLSFMWDWILTLGPWLKSLRTLISGDFEILGNTVSTVVEHQGVGTHAFTLAGFPTEKFQCSIWGKEVRRYTNQAVPLPGIKYSTVFDTLKMLDISIVGVQHIPKRFRMQFLRAFLAKIDVHRLT